MVSTIVNSDALTHLMMMDDESVHCAVTSPPYYGLRDYGVDGQIGLEETPDAYVNGLVEIFRELRRVLRNDGTFWLNIGDSYAGSGRGPTGHNGIGNQTERQGFDKQDTNRGSLKYNPLGGVVPESCKPKDLIGIPWMLAFALRADGWYLRSDIPWIKRNCLAAGTMVYMRSQKGVMPTTIHDMIRLNLNTVEVWNGEKWTKVVHMEQTDIVEDGLEITFRNGEKVTCTRDHRWPTTKGLFNSRDLQVGDVVKHTALPNTGYQSSERVPDEIGRIVGLFLAEGSYLAEDTNAGVVFTFSEKESHLDEIVKAFALKYEGSHHSHTYDTGGKLMSVLHGKIPVAILSTYISGRGSKHKRLSNACWKRSNGFLRELLVGYLEGDGHFDQKNNRWRLGFCENDNLAHDIRTLCARLGISLRLNRGLVSATKGGKLHRIWRGQIRFDLEGKSCNDGGFKRRDDYEIISISKAKSQHFYDIGVEDEPHLFALASGVLTHNSMPSSVHDRPASSIEHIFLFSKSKTYYYDYVATMQPSSESYNKDKRPRGKIRQTVNANSKYPDEGQFKKQDNVGNNTYTGFNARYEDPGTGLRFMRDSDFFFRTWQGLLHNENGEPISMVVNPRGYKGAHFACFPVQLVEPMILAGTSERGVCPECGAPWMRHTEATFVPQEDVKDPEKLSKGSNKGLDTTNGWNDTPRGYTRVETTGWHPTCSHGLESIPATVLDPFSGSGATGVACQWHGRDYIGIELKHDYCLLQQQRLAENK